MVNMDLGEFFRRLSALLSVFNDSKIESIVLKVHGKDQNIDRKQDWKLLVGCS